MELFLSALIIGITLGTIYGLMAFGVVACYRISRVVNLAQAGLAALSASLYWWTATVWGAPLVLGLFGSILVGGLLGAVLGYLNLRMTNVPKGLVMIFTLTITLLLFAWVDVILPGYNASPPSIFGSSGFNVALTYITVDQIGSFVTAIVAVIVTTWFLRKTRFGLFVRAIYDDPQGSATVGIPLTGYVVGVWALAGCMAALGGILVSTRTGLDSPLLLFVMVWGLAGAVLGGLESFAMAFLGGMILGVTQGVLGGMFSASLPPGFENLTAIVIMAAGVLYAGMKRRHLAYLQT